MSWHCSRALAEAFSAATSLDGALSAPSNSTPTPEAFYWPDKTTEHSRLSRFGMTSEPLMADRGAALLTWFLADFHAKTSAQPAEVTGWTASEVGSGRKWLGLLARYDHDSLSWRTPQCSLVEGLDEFSATWPRWGSMRTGECYRRQTLAPTTFASVSGLLPTPTKSWARRGPGLSNNLNNLRMQLGVTQDCLAIVEAVGWRWPASFVEWMMGWPTQWTALKPLETAKFQEWQRQHSVC